MNPSVDQQQLEAWLAKWQRILRLQDWDVTVKLSRAWDMGGNSVATVDSVLTLKQAVIRVLDPIDRHPEDPTPPDYEADLVHELVHLHFDPFMVDEDPNDLIYIAQEQAIEAIARALVQADRSHPEVPPPPALSRS